MLQASNASSIAGIAIVRWMAIQRKMHTASVVIVLKVFELVFQVACGPERNLIQVLLCVAN